MENLVTAVGIKTHVWNAIVKSFTNERWAILYKYDLFDAGIDYDLIVIEKNNERILLGWDNWCEGEIRCSPERLKDLTAKFNYSFEAGEAGSLKPEVVSIFWKS
jgi:hypothetical protein